LRRETFQEGEGGSRRSRVKSGDQGAGKNQWFSLKDSSVPERGSSGVGGPELGGKGKCVLARGGEGSCILGQGGGNVTQSVLPQRGDDWGEGSAMGQKGCKKREELNKGGNGRA